MDGKLFLYNSLTPPRISSAAFVFDLQRFDYVGFSGTDSKWNTSTNIGGHQLTQDDIEGYTSQGNHKIAVDADGDGNYDRYFDYFQSATNYILGNAVATSARSGADSVAAAAQYSANGATIKLLDDITDADGFYIGATKDDTDNNRLKTKATIDLNGHQVSFKYELDKGNAGGVSKAKAFVVEHTNGTEDNGGTEVTITGGTIGTAEDSNANFERLVRSYANLTLHNVLLDGSKLSPQQDISFDGAVLCHTKGVLNLTGNTEIKTQGDDYYAVSGKLSTSSITSNVNAGKLTINVKDNAVIPNIGIYEWGTSWTGTSFENGAVSISGGTVGNISFSEKAVNFGAMAKVTVNGGNVNSITYGNNASSLLTAYAEDSTKTVTYDSRSNASSAIYDLAKKDEWNASTSKSDKFNYVGAADTLKAGNLIISADGVTDKSALNFDGGHSIFAIPESANFSWGGTDSVNYAAAKFAFDSSNTAVTVSGAVVGSGMTSGASIYAGTYSIGSDENTKEYSGILSNKVAKIDASSNNIAMAIRGNSLDNTIYGGDANDTITGNGGQNTFYYSKGADVITDFAVGDKGDKIVLTDESFAPDATKISVSGDSSGNLIVGFNDDNSDKLTFNGNGNLTSKTSPLYGVKFENGKKSYTYTNYSIVDVTNGNANGITLTPSYIGYKLDSDGKFTDDTIGAFTALNPFQTIDGSAVSVTGGIEITGQAGKNYIIGSNEVANTLWGAAGDDTLKGGSKHNNVFKYTAGKDVIEAYSLDGGDKVDITTDKITGAKVSRDRLTFTIDNKNSLTFNPDDKDNAVEKISLQGDNAGFLTKDGHVNGDDKKTFKLFASTKGKIDLASDTLYSGEEIKAINAEDVKKQSVTLVSGSAGGEFTFAQGNRKKDGFEYAGNVATINNYESGYDKVNLGNAGFISGFDVNSGGVAISVSGYTADTNNQISLSGVGASTEVLLHDGNSKGNSFSKLVFADKGILKNKANNPTMATVLSGAQSLEADNSLKKIFVMENVANISIQSGNNKATLDASAANGVILIGGTKNNKFIASGGADSLVYTGGKDAIEDFNAKADKISLSGGDFNLTEAKITLSSKSIKFKFNSKNTLAIKSDSKIESITADGQNYTFSKNAIGLGKNISLTSQFSGTYKIKDGVNYVDGHLVEKNLTYKGTSAPETLIGGEKKTTFKAGGGADSLKGGSGKDIFFYAKGERDTVTIADFEVGMGKDKLKIANGTIHTITSLSGGNGGLQFGMTSGKKGDTSPVGWFNVTSKAEYNNGENTLTGGNDKIKADEVLIKANNTFYWFAKETAYDDDGNILANAGELITANKKVTKAQAAATGYDIIELGYATNLTKTGVAVKAGEYDFGGKDKIKKK